MLLTPLTDIPRMDETRRRSPSSRRRKRRPLEPTPSHNQYSVHLQGVWWKENARAGEFGVVGETNLENCSLLFVVDEQRR
jgi:hypothetical protein